MGFPVRRSARVIVINEDGAVLLFRCIDPHDPRPPTWLTPGGGLEDGEDLHTAACREMLEETGQRVERHELLGPVGVAEGPFTFRGTEAHLIDTYFVWKTSTFVPDADNVDEIEVEIMGEHAWMSPDAIESHPETIYPRELATLVREIHAGVDIIEPRQLAW